MENCKGTYPLTLHCHLLPYVNQSTWHTGSTLPRNNDTRLACMEQPPQPSPAPHIGGAWQNGPEGIDAALQGLVVHLLDYRGLGSRVGGGQSHPEVQLTQKGVEILHLCVHAPQDSPQRTPKMHRHNRWQALHMKVTPNGMK